jgi:hypothetical protein
MVGPDRPNALLETPRRSLLSRCGCSVFRRVEGGRCWHVADVYVLNFEDHFLVDFFGLTCVDIDTVGISWVIPARRSSICWWNSLGCDAVVDRAHCPAIMGWCFSRSLLKFYLQLAIWLALHSLALSRVFFGYWCHPQYTNRIVALWGTFMRSVKFGTSHRAMVWIIHDQPPQILVTGVSSW